MLVASALQQWLRERSSMLRYTYIVCLVRDNSHLDVISFRTPSVEWEGELQQDKQLVPICSGEKNLDPTGNDVTVMERGENGDHPLCVLS